MPEASAPHAQEVPEVGAVLAGATGVGLGVRRRRFDRAEHRPARDGGVHRRQGQRHDLGAAVAHDRDGRLDGGGDARVGAVQRPDRVQADAQPGHAVVDGGGVVGHGIGQRRGVVGVGPGDGGQHGGRVPGGAGHGADVVERFRQRPDAGAADPPVGGLEPHDAAGGGGEADRAPGVAAQRGVALPGRRGDAGAARRDAGPEVGAPGVDRDRQVRVVAAHGALGERELAQDYRAGRPQPRDDRAVGVGCEVAAHHRAAPRRDAGRVAEVLHRHRDAVQRAAVVARGDRGLGGLGLGEGGGGGEGDVGLEGGVEPLDAVELRPRHVHGREFAGGDARREILDGGVGEVEGEVEGGVVGHGGPLCVGSVALLLLARRELWAVRVVPGATPPGERSQSTGGRPGR